MAGGLAKCPHCGNFLIERTINRHLAAFARQVAVNVEMSDGDNDLGSSNALDDLGSDDGLGAGVSLGSDAGDGLGDNDDLGIDNDLSVNDDLGLYLNHSIYIAFLNVIT